MAIRTAAAWLSIAVLAGAANPPLPPRTLHARLSSGFGGEDFVIVEPLGADVRVRVVHVAAVEYCPGLVVEAVEKILPLTTVRKVAATRVCDISQERIERAVKDAPDPNEYIDFMGSFEALVAECGDGNRGFVFKLPPLVDFRRLRRQAPEVHALWHLGQRLRTLVMGTDDHDPFARASPDVRAAREALGTALIPEMLVGRYADYLRPSLTGYTGPPAQRDPRWVEVLERGSFNLAHYVEPVMPSIAINARVFGDVRMKISADPGTGAVTRVEPLATRPLLEQAAVDAIKQWRFAAGAVPDAPVEVTVRFRVRCP